MTTYHSNGLVSGGAIPHEGRCVCKRHDFWRASTEEVQTCPICEADRKAVENDPLWEALDRIDLEELMDRAERYELIMGDTE